MTSCDWPILRPSCSHASAEWLHMCHRRLGASGRELERGLPATGGARAGACPCQRRGLGAGHKWCPRGAIATAALNAACGTVRSNCQPVAQLGAMYNSVENSGVRVSLEWSKMGEPRVRYNSRACIFSVGRQRYEERIIGACTAGGCVSCRVILARQQRNSHPQHKPAYVGGLMCRSCPETCNVPCRG